MQRVYGSASDLSSILLPVQECDSVGVAVRVGESETGKDAGRLWRVRFVRRGGFCLASLLCRVRFRRELLLTAKFG